MYHADEGYKFLRSQVICQNTLAETLALKLPKQLVRVPVELQLNRTHNALHCRLANFSPLSRLLGLLPLRIVDFPVCEVETQRLHADLVLSGNVVFGHDSDFYAVHL